MNPERRDHNAENEMHIVPLNVEQQIPISEIKIDQEEFKVLTGLTEIRDLNRPLPEFLIQQLLEGKRIGIMGEPATGKTSLLYQLLGSAKENAQRLHIPFAPKVAQYDIEFAKEKDRRHHDDGKGNLEGAEFNKRLVEVFMDSTVFEVPGVGMKDERDRGRSAVEEIMENMGNGDDKDTILIALPCNRVLQIYGGILRPYIASLPPEEVFEQLEYHGMNIIGLPKTTDMAQHLQVMFDKMGKEEHVNKIREEERELIASWSLLKEQEVLRERNDFFYDIFEDRFVGLISPPEGSEDVMNKIYRDFGVEITPGTAGLVKYRSRIATEDTKQQAIKFEDDFRNVYNLGSDRGVVAYNPMERNGVTIDLSPLFENR